MNDTVKLLKECDSGCKTAIDGMTQVVKHISSEDFRSELQHCCRQHVGHSKRCHAMLNEMGESTGEPPRIEEAMMHAGTSIKLAIHNDDRHIAEMLAEGANMGMTSISKVMNACPDASESSRRLAAEIIREEQHFYNSMLRYL